MAKGDSGGSSQPSGFSNFMNNMNTGLVNSGGFNAGYQPGSTPIGPSQQMGAMGGQQPGQNSGASDPSAGQPPNKVMQFIRALNRNIQQPGGGVNAQPQVQPGLMGGNTGFLGGATPPQPYTGSALYAPPIAPTNPQNMANQLFSKMSAY